MKRALWHLVEFWRPPEHALQDEAVRSVLFLLIAAMAMLAYVVSKIS